MPTPLSRVPFGLIVCVAAGGLLAMAAVSARQPPAVAVDADDLGGVVTGRTGPEAGVWVIAETTGLPTKFSKTVVTDAQGRYLIPDLPKAQYRVWVRGYGLIDSPAVQASPGATANLTAVPAPDAQAAARIYPAGYWFALMRAPAANEFPGTGPEGNGIAPGMRDQGQWLQTLKSGNC
ncbi:MAG: carboxypeptidase regulatory-like domain-containing protein, partial [Candidatus Sericytochromatia bacterium]|nr:carboxypeptidase regulatory-like domain-containing protein [Candidatus Tanganyikabacteria bacterium]